MSLDRITQKLNQEFESNFSGTHKVVYWEDSKKEYFEFVQTLEIPDVRVLILDGNNFYRSKIDYEENSQTSDYLIYAPFLALNEKFKENWLLDVYFYANKFRPDRVSQIIDDLNLPNTVQIREVVTKYTKFFERQDRIKKFLKYNHLIKNAIDLQLCILATIVSSPEVKLDSIVFEVLNDNLDVNGNKKIDDIKKFGNFEDFINLIYIKYGYEYTDDKPFTNFAAHLFVSGLGVSINIERFPFFKPFFDEKHSENCYSAVRSWAEDTTKKNDLFIIAKTLEGMLQLNEKLKSNQINDLEKLDLFPIFNEVFVLKLSEGLYQNTINPTDVEKFILVRRESLWFDEVREYMEVIGHAASLIKFKQNHQNIKDYNSIKNNWDNYINDYYLMDTYYRKCYTTYFQSLNQIHSDLEDAIKDLLNYIEKLYKNWFLDDLGSSWNDSIKDKLKESYWFENIPKQKDFYFDHVSKTLASNKNVYVIISDALRFEVAKELEQTIKSQLKFQTNMYSMQGIFPSITKLGMAALLPHDQLKLEDDLEVTLDDLPCNDLVSRNKILLKRGKVAHSMSSKNFVDLKRQERSSLLKDKEVVYLYHDVIDAVGDHLSSEKNTFKACEEAIIELRNIVRIILNESLSNTVVITSDHGFVYTYEPLMEFDKISKDYIGTDIKTIARRYAITTDKSNSDFIQDVSLGHLNEKLHAVTPRQYVRFKAQGGGINYVHGGVSLQEIVVPVLKVEKIKGEKSNISLNYAKVDLVSQSKKISNRIFSLDFVQTEAVNDRNQSAKYVIMFKDINGKIVSDQQTITADRTSSSPEDRRFRLRFCLQDGNYDNTMYFNLHIYQQNDKELVESCKIPFEISILFSGDFDL